MPFHDPSPRESPVTERAPSAPPARPRLVEALLEHRGLILLRAVPGGGRTTVAAAWAERRRADGTTVGWIDSRPGLDRPENLVAAAAAALHLTLPCTGFEMLGEELRRAPSPVALILDDADDYLTEETGSALASLCARLPGLTVLVIGRRIRPGGGTAVEIAGRDFHATPDELTDLLRSAGTPLDAGAAAELHGWFRGWLVPSIAAARAWRASEAVGTPPELARRAAQERGLATAATFLATAPADGMLLPLWLWQLGGELTLESAVAALGEPLPMPTLLDLEAEGAVVPDHGERPRWLLTLGDLLADAVFERYAEAHPDLARAAHRRLAAFARGRDRGADALRHAVSAADWDLAGELIGEHWSALLSTDKRALRDALNAFPQDFLDRYPRWVEARAYINHQPVSGPVRTVRFARASRREAVDLMDVLATATAQVASLRSAGRTDEALAAVADVAEILDDVAPAHLDEVAPVLADLRTQWARASLLGGEIAEARREYEVTYDEALHHGNLRIAVDAAGALALLHALGGWTGEAELWLDRIPAYPSADAPDTVHAIGHLARAVLALNRLDLDEAERILAQDTRITDGSEYAELQLVVRSLVTGLGGEPLAALTALRSSRRDGRGSRWRTGTNAVARAEAESLLLVLAGRYNDAAHALELGPVSVQLEEFLLVARARAALAAGHPHDAAGDAYAALAIDPLSARAAVGAHLVLAGALAEQGDVEAAADSARTAGSLAVEHRLLLPLGSLARPDLDRLVHALPADTLAVVDSIRLPVKAERPLPSLTQRERLIVAQLIAGLDTTDMAEAAFVSRNTVKAQLRTLYRKLGVHSRQEAIARVREAGLVGGPAERWGSATA